MIVNPWLFYLMNVCSSAKIVAVLLMIIGVAGTLVLGVVIAALSIDGEDENAGAIKRFFTLSCWIFVISVLAVVFIPDKDTLLMMQAAKLATVDNVNAVFEALKSAIDYVVTVMK